MACYLCPRFRHTEALRHNYGPTQMCLRGFRRGRLHRPGGGVLGQGRRELAGLSEMGRADFIRVESFRSARKFTTWMWATSTFFTSSHSSRARRSGFCGLHPISRRMYHTRPGWYRTPNSRSITWATRLSVHNSVGNPAEDFCQLFSLGCGLAFRAFGPCSFGKRRKVKRPPRCPPGASGPLSFAAFPALLRFLSLAFSPPQVDLGNILHNRCCYGRTKLNRITPPWIRFGLCSDRT